MIPIKIIQIDWYIITQIMMKKESSSPWCSLSLLFSYSRRLYVNLLQLIHSFGCVSGSAEEQPNQIYVGYRCVLLSNQLHDDSTYKWRQFFPLKFVFFQKKNCPLRGQARLLGKIFYLGYSCIWNKKFFSSNIIEPTWLKWYRQNKLEKWTSSLVSE